ncbi:MAG: hypothetical protein QXQ87_04170 [Halobacteria archaeon]
MRPHRFPRHRLFYAVLPAATLSVGGLAILTPPESALFLLNAVFQGILGALALLIAGFVFLKQRLSDFERHLQDAYDDSRTEVAEYLDRLKQENLLDADGQRLRSMLEGWSPSQREKVEALVSVHSHFTPARVLHAIRKAAEHRFPEASPRVEASPYGLAIFLEGNGERLRIQVDARGARLSREGPDGVFEEQFLVSRRIKPLVEEFLRFADLSFRFDTFIRRLPVREYSFLNVASSRQFSLGFLIILCFTASTLLSMVLLAVSRVAGPAFGAGMGVTVGLSAFGICLLSYLLLLILRS